MFKSHTTQLAKKIAGEKVKMKEAGGTNGYRERKRKRKLKWLS